MTHSNTDTANLIRRLTHDADEAETEGQAWEAAACRAGALYLEAMEREQARKAEAARAEVRKLLVEADRRQPPPVPAAGSAARRTLLH